MLNLIAKDIKLLFGGRQSGKSRWVSLLFGALALALGILLESYLYREILTKLSSFPGAALSFTTLFLFILSCLSMVFCLFQAEKLFFDESDRRDMDALPVPAWKKGLSKLVLLLFLHFVLNFLLCYPILLSYGLVVKKLPFYFFSCIFYPLGMFLFEAGIALALSYPLHALKKLLKSRPWLEFVSSIVILGLLSFAYAKVLGIFVSLVSGSGVNALLTDANLSRLVAARKYFVVAADWAPLFISGSIGSLGLWAAFSFSSFALGLGVLLPLYAKESGSKETTPHVKAPSYRPLSPSKAYLKKEFTLLLRDSESLFGYSGLLFAAPYLALTVLASLNAVFSSSTVAYYFVSLPHFATYLDFFALLLFFSALSSGGMEYLSREGNSIRILKTIPIDPKKQIRLKIAPTLIASSLSMLVCTLVVSISGTLGYVPSFLAFFYGEGVLFTLSLLSMMEEMKKGVGKAKNSLLSTLYGYGLPILFLGLAALLSFLRLNTSLVYLCCFALLLVLSLPFVVWFGFKQRPLWDEMEVAS